MINKRVIMINVYIFDRIIKYFNMKIKLLFLLSAAVFAKAQIPEVLYYKFDGTGTTVPNLASAPTSGALTANILGSITQSPTNNACLGGALTGTNASALSDYLSTGWDLSLSGSWTINFKINNYTYSGSELNYLFGDVSTGAQLRMFTNGVAGANNLLLRGTGITDFKIVGVFPITTPKTITIVYDNTTQDMKGYVNGVLAVTVHQTSPLVINGANFRVGGYGNATTTFGLRAGMTMDEFGIFNRAITAPEIQSLNNFCANLSTNEASSNKNKSKIYTKENYLLIDQGKFGKYSIFDMSGRAILSGTENSNVINISNLQKGVYIINYNNTSQKFSY